MRANARHSFIRISAINAPRKESNEANYLFINNLAADFTKP